MPLRKMMFVKLGHNVTMCHFRTRLSGAFDDPEKIGLFSGFVFDISGFACYISSGNEWTRTKMRPVSLNLNSNQT